PPAKEGGGAAPRRRSPTLMLTRRKGAKASHGSICSHGLHDDRADAVRRAASVRSGHEPHDLRDAGPVICRGLALRSSQMEAFGVALRKQYHKRNSELMRSRDGLGLAPAWAKSWH